MGDKAAAKQEMVAAGVPVCGRVDRDRLDPQLVQRADHAHGYLSAVGDEDAAEHG